MKHSRGTGLVTARVQKDPFSGPLDLTLVSDHLGSPVVVLMVQRTHALSRVLSPSPLAVQPLDADHLVELALNSLLLKGFAQLCPIKHLTPGGQRYTRLRVPVTILVMGKLILLK